MVRTKKSLNAIAFSEGDKLFNKIINKAKEKLTSKEILECQLNHILDIYLKWFANNKNKDTNATAPVLNLALKEQELIRKKLILHNNIQKTMTYVYEWMNTLDIVDQLKLSVEANISDAFKCYLVFLKSKLNDLILNEAGNFHEMHEKPTFSYNFFVVTPSIGVLMINPFLLNFHKNKIFNLNNYSMPKPNYVNGKVNQSNYHEKIRKNDLFNYKIYKINKFQVDCCNAMMIAHCVNSFVIFTHYKFFNSALMTMEALGIKKGY